MSYFGRNDHGCIYVTGGSGSQSITTGGTYEKVTQFTVAGATRGLTSDHTNDLITLPTIGMYLVSFSASFQGSNNSTLNVRVHWNSVAQNQIHITRKLGTGTDTGNASAIGLVTATVAGQDVEVFWTADSDSNLFDAKEMSLTVVRMT